ncbi:MAG: hypothetical protein J2P15_21740, partial [Micromonosporaceae bacterium]|nr:hypothetical protein [Micromonosporaceae bacterium]
LDRQALLPWFPDPRLAPASAPASATCPAPAWYLVTGHALLRRDPCTGGWSPVGLSQPLHHPRAVAAAGHWLAATDHSGVSVWWREGDQLVAVLPEPDARLVALASNGVAYVARQDGTDLWRYRAGGAPAGVVPGPQPGRVAGLRIGGDRTLWLLAGDGQTLRLWRRGPCDHAWQQATVAQLSAALPPSDLFRTWDGGFCLHCDDPCTAESADCCYTWQGERVEPPPPLPPNLVTDGELDTVAVDSGLPRCRWHRVSVEAEVPAGSSVQVAVAVTEEPPAPDGGTVPGPTDWQQAPPGTLDFLIQQPPGRYLYLRLRLTGNGSVTPVVRRIRLDFPRLTSADLLPPGFREDPAADDFTERFLSMFDQSLAGIDRVIDRYPALLDSGGVPDEVLPWLGGLLGLAFEAGWDAQIQRQLLAAAPELYRRRGTAWAVGEAVRIVFGVQPVIEEQAAQRSFIRLSEAGRLGTVRLFGRSRARFRVGTSALSSAPVRSDGDPYEDPLRVDAYRFRVALPPHNPGPVDLPALGRLVASQAPAHTAATIHTGGLGWVVGVWSAVGVDTAFVALPAPVLGASTVDENHQVRLGRHSVLAPSRRGPVMGMAVGQRSAVGLQSVSW